MLLYSTCAFTSTPSGAEELSRESFFAQVSFEFECTNSVAGEGLRSSRESLGIVEVPTGGRGAGTASLDYPNQFGILLYTGTRGSAGRWRRAGLDGTLHLVKRYFTVIFGPF